MKHNLTQKQLTVLRWIVEQVRAEKLKEEFGIYWTNQGPVFSNFGGSKEAIPDINKGVIDALTNAGAIQHTSTMRTSKSGQVSEASRTCVLAGKAFEIVDSNSNWGSKVLFIMKKIVPAISYKVASWLAAIAATVIGGLFIHYITSS